MNEKQSIRKIIQPLFDDYQETITPATEDQIEKFKSEAQRRGVPDKAIEELVLFYRVSNGIPCLNALDIHSIDDIILYENWDLKEIWFGQKEEYVIRWTNGKFHIGDIGDISLFGYSFDSVVELLRIGFHCWFEDEYK
jgi:hypothetical protein